MDTRLLGEKIQELRKARGMTQKDLAGFLGYSESFVSYVEKGERKIAIDDVQKIAKIFSVDMDFLIGKPKVSHFRSTTDQNDPTDYDKMMNDFLKYVDGKL